MKFSAFTLLITLLFCAGTACNNDNVVDVVEETALAKVNMNKVSYGHDTAQTIDIYLPANRDMANTKVLLFIHGGSWSGGDKNEFNQAISAISAKLPDYAVFNMNYRLAYNGHNRFPAQLNDVQAALHFIQQKANDFKINANKVCLIGASAGAHLALLYAYKNNHDGRIKAVIDLFGPTDLTTLYYNHPVPAASRPVLVNLLGATPATNPVLYQQASPINFVSAKTVPTQIFHGASDVVVPVTQSRELKAKLQANAVKVDMIAYSGEGHGWYGNNLVDTYSKSVEFIKENVR
jgi:acetyl esterase/lipase